MNGNDLRNAFEAATRCLERQRDAINALNVFPVPDGDTGTNMLLTMRSVNEECRRSPVSSAGEALAAMAHGALLGARGNSGVILSQFFNGIAQGALGKHEIGGADLAEAFQLASQAAYSSVSSPVEGTMLTVIGDLSKATARRVDEEVTPEPLSIWNTAVDAAREAVLRTPLQLPVLREAGVVDAGGQGLLTLLQGAYLSLSGENVDEVELELCTPYASAGEVTVQEEFLSATEEDLYGYCTQFLIHGQELDVDDIRKTLAGMAHSTVVVGTPELAKVHVHTEDPGRVISFGVSLGTLAQVSAENIDQQHQEFVALHRGQAQRAEGSTEETARAISDSGTAVVATTWGDGFTELFQALGCSAVVRGGQTMNPSTKELLDAGRSTGAKDVILLPNNSNIIPAARQAVELANESASEDPSKGQRLHVIPSRTIPQGVAALLAFNSEEDMEENLSAMNRALGTVKTVEVTQAVRPATLNGIVVEKGQYIGLVDGDLATTGDSALATLQQALAKLEPTAGRLITLYRGEAISEDDGGEAANALREANPGAEVELVYGGQPLYQFIASLE